MPYVTPETTPPTLVCRRFLISLDVHMIAALFGQVLELTESENWEQTTGISVDDTIAFWSDIYDDMVLMATCNPPPSGGADDYTLEIDITLVADTTSYTLTDLETLDGEDLLIQVELAGTTTGRRNVDYEINGNSDDEYHDIYQRFSSSATFNVTELTNGRIQNLAPPTATPQLAWGVLSMDFLDWKNSAKWNAGNYHGYSDIESFVGRHEHKIVAALSSFKIWLGAGDLREGTNIKVYTRG